MYERGYSEEVGLWSAKGRRAARVTVISALHPCMKLSENKFSKNILKYLGINMDILGQFDEFARSSNASPSHLV